MNNPSGSGSFPGNCNSSSSASVQINHQTCDCKVTGHHNCQAPVPQVLLEYQNYEGLKALEILRLEDRRREEARRLGIEFVEHPLVTNHKEEKTYDSDL